MMREQRIMERIVNELGEELNEYIKTFYSCDLWTIKEGELKVNKTFKRLVNIIADYNLTTGEEILDSAYNLIQSNEVMLSLMDRLCASYLQTGGSNLLNRTLLFCYFLFMMTREQHVSATEVLNKAVRSDLLHVETTFWHTIKYKLGLVQYPYKFKADVNSIALVALLKGSSVDNIVKDVAEYKELI